MLSLIKEYVKLNLSTWMKTGFLSLKLFFILGNLQLMAQVIVTGSLMDLDSFEPLMGVKVTVDNRSKTRFTNEEGYFEMELNLTGDLLLSCEMSGYKTIRIPITIKEDVGSINLEQYFMSKIAETPELNDYIEIHTEQLDDEQIASENIAVILSAGKDLFSRTAAFDFGPNFFKPRLLGPEHATVMLNGVRLNKAYSGRPEWSNWGGLNDALRLQERYEGLRGTPYGVGGLSSSVNMISLASVRSRSFKVSLAHSNKSYTNRLMLTYASGVLKHNWSYSLAGSVRLAKEGYRSGTNYLACSFFASVDKQLNSKQSLNATFIYAANTRGKYAPITQEVYELKNARYNSYWGYQQGEKRNSRQKKILEPILQLNYDHKLGKGTRLHGNFTFQFGNASSGRLDYSGGRPFPEEQIIIGGGFNPDPSYYQKLPSYFLRDVMNPDYGRAFLAEETFKERGQIDWQEMYQANSNTAKGNSIYVLYEDRRQSRFWSLNSGVSANLNVQFSVNGAVSVSESLSDHFALLKDLLGGNGFFDVDTFEDDITRSQSNLQTPNRLVGNNEKFKYNYQLKVREYNLYVQGQYRSSKTDISLGIDYRSSRFQRTGLYENGAHPGNASLGNSRESVFHLPTAKLGISHRFSGRHIVTANTNFLKMAPTINNAFSNIRISNSLVKNLKPVIFKGFDMKYNWRHSQFNAVLSVYYLLFKDESKVSYYYADGLTGIDADQSGAFVQEVLTGIGKQNYGLEFSLEVPIFTELKLKTVASFGISQYTSNPDLYLTSNVFEDQLNAGKSNLKGYMASGGPQSAYSVGFEYSSPKYWWLSASLNFFDNSFISIAPISRTKHFFLDSDGYVINDVDPDLAKEFLIQESLEPYKNLNLAGGKSWKIRNSYLGFFISINNLTNEIYKTGGFEQSRNANYNTLLEDSLRPKPLFGPKYWFSLGTTFFTSLYIRI